MGEKYAKTTLSRSARSEHRWSWGEYGRDDSNRQQYECDGRQSSPHNGPLPLTRTKPLIPSPPHAHFFPKMWEKNHFLRINGLSKMRPQANVPSMSKESVRVVRRQLQCGRLCQCGRQLQSTDYFSLASWLGQDRNYVLSTDPP